VTLGIKRPSLIGTVEEALRKLVVTVMKLEVGQWITGLRPLLKLTIGSAMVQPSPYHTPLPLQSARMITPRPGPRVRLFTASR
jgi:hypothetical protein